MLRLTDQEVDAIARTVAAKMAVPGRIPMIAGNWKMHITPSQTATLLASLMPLVRDASCDIVVAPSFVCLDRAARTLAGSNIRLAAQNLHWEAPGAFTGEVAAEMLVDLGVKYVIAGHSERRLYFGETDKTVNRRVQAALSAGLEPILCAGESLAERQDGRTEEVVCGQVEAGIAGLGSDQVMRLIVAYEPVWAIGTGKVASTDQAQEVHAQIRELIGKRFDSKTAGSLRILYGGSVKPANAAALLAQPDIDGALVGGASLIPSDLAAICLAA